MVSKKKKVHKKKSTKYKKKGISKKKEVYKIPPPGKEEYEREIQQNFTKYLRKKYPGLRSNASQAGNFNSRIGGCESKRMGSMKGYPDYFIPCKFGKYSGLYIEFKRPPKIVNGKWKKTDIKRPRKLSTIDTEEHAQFIWLEILKSEGFLTTVIDKYDDAVNLLEKYFAQNKKKRNQFKDENYFMKIVKNYFDSKKKDK